VEDGVELELTSDQEFFAETTRKFLEDKTPVSELRAKRNDAAGFDPSYWTQGAELGWTSLLVSEEDGGGSISGRPLADLMLVAFEFGNHAAPGPLVPASIVAGALSRAGSAEQKAGPLAEILSGEAIGTWAYAEPRPNDGFGTVTVTAEVDGGNVRLNGVKAPVESAAQAQYVLVTARTGEGLTQVLVPTDAAGVTITPMKSVGLTRHFAKVSLDNVELPASAVVGEVGGAAGDVDWQTQVAILLELNEMVGAMDRAFKMTHEWSFDRYSFGRPLASYQELKHRFADMKLWLEASHAITDGATKAVEDGDPEAWDLLSAAKAYVGHYGPELMHDCVQMHGGIGVTFEHDMHLYLRRVVLGSRLHGSVGDHRERLTASLEKKEEAA
jgi:alkylation response protein AidB-like acyl-CoA dehydrogenase